MSHAKAGDSLGVARLQTILKHCTLRRTKDSTDTDGNKILNLPPRNERIVNLQFSPEEKELYNTHFAAGRQKMTEGDEAGKINLTNILQYILRLRQICDHSVLLSEKDSDDLDADLKASGMMECLDSASAAEGITTNGLSYGRAFTLVNSLKTENSLCCSLCDITFNIPDTPNADDAEDEEYEDKATKAKGKKTKTPLSAYPIVTRCCHLYCEYFRTQNSRRLRLTSCRNAGLSCFQTEVFSDWPKGAADAGGRPCGVCGAGLNLSTDVIGTAPGSRLIADGPEKKVKRKRAITDDFQYSVKMKALQQDLMEYSVVNPHSRNFDPMSADVAEVDEKGEPLITKSIVLCVYPFRWMEPRR